MNQETALTMFTKYQTCFIHLYLIICFSQSFYCLERHFGQCESKVTSFRVVYNVDLVKCAEECGRRHDCHRLNYHRRTKECTFHSAPVVDTELIQGGGLVNSQTAKRIWNSDGSILTGNAIKSCVIIYKNDLYIPCFCSQGMACQTDGSCKLEECKSPSVVNTGYLIVSGNILSIGSIIKVSCKSPYKLLPNNEYVTCDDTGQWGGFPTCKIFCYNPCRRFPYTETVSPGISVEGEMRTYACQPGFHLHSSPTKTSFEIMCISMTTWAYWQLPPDRCVNVSAGIFPKHPENIRYIGCFVYEINNFAVTQSVAYSECMPYGRLARLSSQTMQEYIQNYLNASTIRAAYWIQGRLDTADKIWKFNDGAHITNFLWGEGQPSHNSECITMNSAQHYLWNDTPCYFQKGYICEYF